MTDDGAGQEIVEFVVQGTTLDGKACRPSDWVERLCGVMAVFGGDQRLAQLEPMACQFLQGFARDTERRIRDGRVAERAELARQQRARDGD